MLAYALGRSRIYKTTATDAMFMINELLVKNIDEQNEALPTYFFALPI